MKEIFFSTQAEQFKTLIRNALEEYHREIVLPHLHELARPPEKILLTRKEVAELLSIQVQTVDKYARKGLLQRHTIYGSTRFKRTQVLDAVHKNDLK